MTRFRCAIVDEAGVAGTRVIDARSRDQAMLLLLAEGVTPSSITRDAPSLAERIGPAAADGAAEILLQDLARLVASGFTIPEAAAAIDGEPAKRIAAGAPVGEIMTASPGLPRWIGSALTLVAGREDEPRTLIDIADDAAAIALRARVLRSAQIEAGLMATAIGALVAAVISIDFVAGLALLAAIYLTLRRPFHAFRRSMRSVRHADFLLVTARLMTAGAELRDAIRIADHDKMLIDANDADLRTEMGIRLGLSAADQAIIAHGDAPQAMRTVSVHLARSAMPAIEGLVTIVRMSLVVIGATVLIWSVAR